jgi:CDP-diacylglycerol--glycerol-3-phosphate 3-phosphatidyltransferase
MDLDRPLRRRLAPVATAVARPFRHVHPVALTLAAGVLGISGAALVAIGYPAGAALAAVGVLLDGIDGPVARLADRESRFGAWLDSTIDRAVDFALAAALGWRGHVSGDDALLAAGMAAAAGSFLASYARARAEGLEVYTTEGIAPRWVRLCLIALAAGALAAGRSELTVLLLVAIALLGLITAAARGVAVFLADREA